jgi:hypothetical protein
MKTYNTGASGDLSWSGHCTFLVQAVGHCEINKDKKDKKIKHDFNLTTK